VSGLSIVREPSVSWRLKLLPDSDFMAHGTRRPIRFMGKIIERKQEVPSFMAGKTVMLRMEVKQMNRRKFLENSAIVLAGSALTGCDATGSSNKEPGSLPKREMYERGTVPIDTSGWATPGGVLPGYPALEKHLDADVVVIGAGLAGGSLALHLAEAGINVVLLEARQPGWGGSGRNAGHVLPLLKTLKVFEQFPDGGKKFLELFKQHRSIAFDLAKKHGIACDALDAGYLNAIEYKWVFKRWKEKALHLEKTQGLEFELVGGAEMEKLTGSKYYPYGVLWQTGGRINPYLFTNGLVSAAVQHGASVFGESEAESLTKSGDRWRVDVAKGSVVADRVVFCTNAYPTKIIPEFTNSYYPLTAYALSTKPLPKEALEIIMPSRACMVQQPIDLNPSIVDGRGRIIAASIPHISKPENAAWHFKKYMRWIHRTWPQTKEFNIELENYWTGMVAMRDQEFPGVFEVKPGVFGLMHFNAWGNLMAPLMGMLLADAIAKDRMDQLPFPLEKPESLDNQGKQNFIIRKILIPAARVGQRIGII
jgi:glycine/D-amino acid oxidase-like deaminating enzyme